MMLIGPKVIDLFKVIQIFFYFFYFFFDEGINRLTPTFLAHTSGGIKNAVKCSIHKHFSKLPQMIATP